MFRLDLELIVKFYIINNRNAFTFVNCKWL